MNRTELWVLAIILLVALAVIFLGVQTTGNASKHLNTVRYRSCHYLDYDVRGECMRIERQNSNHCSPEENIPKDYERFQRPMNWFYRICENPKSRASW